MSPVDVANEAPDADLSRLCSASRRTNAVGVEGHGGDAVGGGAGSTGERGFGQPRHVDRIAKMPPDCGSRASSSASRSCRALVT